VILAGVLALVAGAMFGAGTAMQAQASARLRPRSVVHFGSLASVVSRPLWLAGTALDWLGALLHIAALHFGPLTLVQPLSLSAIAFAVPAEALLLRLRPTKGQVAAALETAAGLALVAGALGRDLHTSPPTFASSSIGITVAVLAVGLPLVVATRCRRGRQALLVGMAAGACYGLSDALVRAVQVPSLATVLGGPWFLLVSTALIAGCSGLVLTQAALQKGGLSASLPAQDLLALIVSVGLGAALIGEAPRLGITAVLALLVALGLVGHGTALLTRRLVTSLPEDLARPAGQRTRV
jgi:hypothetical protein